METISHALVLNQLKSLRGGVVAYILPVLILPNKNT